jgi:hypothetical protein
MRRDPLAVRKATLASLLRRAAPGLRFNEHLDEEDGPLVFAHASERPDRKISDWRESSQGYPGVFTTRHLFVKERPLCTWHAGLREKK